jgi:uncharacterized protein YjbI with pentapeptide repeats
LDGANLHDANLDGANLQDATYNSHTRFSAGFDPEAAGMTKR